MKKYVLMGGILLAAVPAFLTSFVAPAPNSTGGVEVTTVHDGKPVAEVLVGISKTEEDRENSEYISEKETNAQGKVTFSSIAAGHYYLDAFVTTDDGDLYAEAEVTVADGIAHVTMSLIEEEDED